MRVCLVYDCLYPYTIGGAERWYREMALRLAEEGHRVTYLTLRQWDEDVVDLPGVEVITVGPRMKLYTQGRRRLWPPLRFGFGVFWHLLRHGRRYQVIHTAASPMFGLLGIAAARPFAQYRILVDWHEVWTQPYWQEYLGRRLGLVGWRVQRLCLRVPQQAFCFARLYQQRMREEGFTGQIQVLEGEYAGDRVVFPNRAQPKVVFAGRFIPEKRVPALVRAFAVALQQEPQLRLVLYGDGPEREMVLGLVQELGLEGVVEAPGFVDTAEVQRAFKEALCVVQPSRREGYGLIVVEASALGTPSVVISGEDNAAVELVEDGVNGVVAAAVSPDVLAAAILRVWQEGPDLRATTVNWYRQHEVRLSLRNSLETVVNTYRRTQEKSVR